MTLHQILSLFFMIWLSFGYVASTLNLFVNKTGRTSGLQTVLLIFSIVNFVVVMNGGIVWRWM